VPVIIIPVVAVRGASVFQFVAGEVFFFTEVVNFPPCRWMVGWYFCFAWHYPLRNHLFGDFLVEVVTGVLLPFCLLR
jgi:hypothetical protein